MTRAQLAMGDAPRAIARGGAATMSGTQTVQADLDRSDLRVILYGLPGPVLLYGALLTGSYALGIVASSVILVVAAFRPSIGLMEMALIAPILGRPIIPYPGLLFGLVAATILGSLFRLPIDRPRVSLPAPIGVVALFMLYVAVQQLPDMLAGYEGSSLNIGSVFLRYLTAAAAAIAAGWVLMRRPPYPYLAGLLAAGMLASALSLGMYFQPSLIAALGDLILRPERTVRPAGALVDPNYFGMLMVTLMVTGFAWLLAVRRRATRLALLAALAVLGAGLAVSQSRSAMVALALGMLVAAVVRSRRAALALLAIIAAGSVVLVPAMLEWRLTNSGGAYSDLALSRLAESDAGRLDLVLEGPKLFLQSPVFGVGLGGFLAHVGDASHNWYSVVLAEQGLIGVILVSILVIVLFRSLRDRPNAARSMGYGVLTVLAVGSFFLEPTLETQWSVPAVIVVTCAIVADWRMLDPDTLPGVRSRMPGDLGAVRRWRLGSGTQPE